MGNRHTMHKRRAHLTLGSSLYQLPKLHAALDAPACCIAPLYSSNCQREAHAVGSDSYRCISHVGECGKEYQLK